MMSRFSNVELFSLISDLAITRRFSQDSFERKIDLGIGVNYNDYGLQIVFSAVRDAERILTADRTLYTNFLPLEGLEPFIDAAIKLVLGRDSPAIESGRVFGLQVAGGTAGLRLSAEFLKKSLSIKYIYCSEPSIKNHKNIFTTAGLQYREFRYWSEAKRCLNLDGMLTDLKNAPEGSAVLLYACSHNPTGCDLSQEEWKQVVDVIESKDIFPIIHMPFLGLASGSFDTDSWIVRYLAEKRITMICVQSFSKILGLSSERIAALIFVSTDIYACEVAKAVLKFLIRVMYSEPPSYGARIATFVMKTPMLLEGWKKDIGELTLHCKYVRKRLRLHLENLQTPGNWSHLTSQQGVFSYSGLNERQVLYLIQKYHIYMPFSGRISLCAIAAEKVRYVAEAIHHTVITIGG